VAVFLMPAVFLTRHRDATWRARTLLIGLFLVAISQALLIASTPLQPVFAGLTPATPELPIIWSSAFFDDVTSLIFAFGLAYMALGLTQARRYEGRTRSLTLLFVTVLAIFGTVVGIVSVARIDLGSLAMSAGLAFYLASIVVFGVVRIVAWGYLTAAAAGGTAAGEDPPAGWRLATLGGTAVLVALLMVNIGGLFEITDQTLDTAYGYVTIVFYALGLVLLLAAFVVGLPTLPEPGADGVDEDDE
jgi:cytochrome c biogenesis factor